MKLSILTATAALTVAAVAAPAAITPARAGIVDILFTAVVGGDQPDTIIPTAGATTANSGYVDGQTISGELVYDNAAHTFSKAVLGTFTAPLSDASSGETPANDTITFRSGTVGNGITAADNIQLTLAALTSFTAPTFGQPLDLPKQSQIDFDNSVVSLLIQGPNGVDTVIQAVLTSAQLPEPVSLSLLGAGLAGLAAIRRRRA